MSVDAVLRKISSAIVSLYAAKSVPTVYYNTDDATLRILDLCSLYNEFIFQTHKEALFYIYIKKVLNEF